MSEEYGNDFVTLIDEDGNEVEFEHIDTVEYNGVTYLAFIPAEISIEEDAEVVIMQIVEENGEELLEAVEDDEIADAVFNIVMERAMVSVARGCTVAFLTPRPCASTKYSLI